MTPSVRPLAPVPAAVRRAATAAAFALLALAAGTVPASPPGLDAEPGAAPAPRPPDDPAAVVAQAAEIRRLDHEGTLRDGKFRRSVGRGGMAATALEHDRVRALRLLEPLLPRADGLAPPTRASLYSELADSLLLGREGDRSWLLFSATDLSVVPEPAPDLPVKTGGAPADADGAPVLHAVPPSWGEALTDGERWRWALARLADVDPAAAASRLAYFAWRQFGAGTLPAPGPGEIAAADDPADPYGLASLGSDEMVARLAPGVRRFRLPPEWNPAVLLSAAHDADSLGRWHESRLRNDLALAVYRADPVRFADRIAAIGAAAVVVRPVPGPITPERPAAFEFAARNAERVDFEIRPVGPAGLERIVAGSGIGFSASPPDVDSKREDTRLLFREDRGPGAGVWTNDLGAVVASWSETLAPAPPGRLRAGRTAPPAPLPGGVYRMRASVPGGDEASVVFEVLDTAVLLSPPNRPSSRPRNDLGHDPAPPQTAGLLLADACDGRPVAGAEGRIEFRRGLEAAPVPAAAVRTDPDGTASFRWPDAGKNYAAHGSARGVLSGPGPRHAVYAADSPGTASRAHADRRFRAWGDRPAGAIVLDRPVCPPGGTVRFKLWLSSQDPADPAPARTNLAVRVDLVDRWGQFLAKGAVATGETDALGTLSGSFRVPVDLAPGVYRIGAQGDRTGPIRIDAWLRVAALRAPGPADEPPAPAPFEPPGPATSHPAWCEAVPDPTPRDKLPLALRLDRDRYAPGDVARVVLRAERPDAWALVTTRAGTDRARSEWIRLDGREAAFELPLEEADRPNVFVEAVAFHDGRFLSDRVSVDLPPAARLAAVALDAPAHAEPGTRAEVRVRVAGPDGRPAANASVALSVCAARLFEFAPPEGDCAPPDESIWGWRNELHSYFQTNPGIASTPDLTGRKAPPALAGDRFACPWWWMADYIGRQAPPAPGGESIPVVMSAPVLLARPPEPDAVPVAPALAEPLLWLPELEPAGEPGVYRSALDLPDVPADWTIRAWATLPGSVLGHAEATLSAP